MRIKVGTNVSTECWRFDGRHKNPGDRWSYHKFGENWADVRLAGVVKARAGGNRWLVKWTYDGTEREISTEHLVNEGNFCHLKTGASVPTYLTAYLILMIFAQYRT